MVASRAGLAACILLTITACGRSVLTIAAAELNCAEDTLTAETVVGLPAPHRLEKVSGCDNMTLYYKLGGKWVSPLERASSDMSCPKEQITGTPLDDKLTIGMSGCGKKAVYIVDVDEGWTLNSGSKPAE